MVPATCIGPGVVSMKVEWLQGAPSHLHTQTSYAGTTDNTRRRVYMPATIIVARGLVRPMLWCGWCFSGVRERVKEGARRGIKIGTNTPSYPNLFVIFSLHLPNCCFDLHNP